MTWSASISFLTFALHDGSRRRSVARRRRGPSSDLTAEPSTWLLVSSSASERIFSASKKKSCETSSGKKSSTSWLQCSECQRSTQAVEQHPQLLAHLAPSARSRTGGHRKRALHRPRRIGTQSETPAPSPSLTPWWIDLRRNSSYASPARFEQRARVP